MPTKGSTRNNFISFITLFSLPVEKKMAYTVVGEEVGGTKTGGHGGSGGR